jgi:hypothetical protein
VPSQVHFRLRVLGRAAKEETGYTLCSRLETSIPPQGADIVGVKSWRRELKLQPSV